MSERVWTCWGVADGMTDAEVLSELGAVRIWDACEECLGAKYVVGDLESPDAGLPSRCPSCGGTGRTLREGVERKWMCEGHDRLYDNGDTHWWQPDDGPSQRSLFAHFTTCRWVYVVPASLIEGKT